MLVAQLGASQNKWEGRKEGWEGGREGGSACFPKVILRLLITNNCGYKPQNSENVFGNKNRPTN